MQFTNPNDILYNPDPTPDPEDEFPEKRPIELIFTALIVMVITADIAVIVACKVYKNWSSSFLMGATVLLILFRLIDYSFRLLKPRFSVNYPYWERIEVDMPSYVFGIISIVLLFQWVQTYQVLQDPIRAMNNTMSSNVSFYCQIIFVVMYSIFILVDFAIINYDHQMSYEDYNVRKADKIFVFL